MKAIEVLGPLETEKKQECLEILERTKDHDDYLELIKRAKNSAEIRSDIVDMNLVLAKRKYDYIEFLKTDAGKKCEAFEQRLKRCIEDYRNAKSEAEEAEVDSRFTAVFAEIDAMSAKERTAIKEYLKGYGGTFAASYRTNTVCDGIGAF